MKDVLCQKNTELEEDKQKEKSEEKEDVGEHCGTQEGGEEGGELRPPLPEGFYEVEGVQRKRVRKGEPQYFIKWRGWPESANTWEPLENLEMCLDIVEAFEESSREGKERPPQNGENSSGCPVRRARKKQHSTAAMASPVVARQTRSARKIAMAQPIGVQFHNTEDNPVIIDDDE